MLAALNPLHAANAHDFAEVGEEWAGLFGEGPIGVEEKPSGREMREVLYQLVEELPFPRRVRDDEVRVVEVYLPEVQSVLNVRADFRMVLGRGYVICSEA